MDMACFYSRRFDVLSRDSSMNEAFETFDMGEYRVGSAVSFTFVAKDPICLETNEHGNWQMGPLI